MPRPIKKYLVKLLLVLLAVARGIGKVLLSILKILALPFIWMWKLWVRRLAFLIYRLILRLKIATGTLVDPIQKTAIAVLGHRYVVHGMMLLIVLFVSVKSLAARATDLSQQSKDSLIYQLAPQSSDEADFAASSDVPDTGFLDATLSASGTGEVLTYDQSGVATPVIVPGTGVSVQRVVISKPQKYTVQSGDTIGEIAQKYGISINTILWANGMTARSLIRPGQDLTILPVSGVLHKIVKGETVGGIAKKYGVDVDRILAANRVDSVSAIQIGEDLVIPDARPPAEAAPPVATNRRSRYPTTPDAQKNVFGAADEAPPSEAAPEDKLAWPTDQHRINQYFHWGHPAIDINGNMSNSIYAADDGIVTFAGWNSGGYGNMVLIDHGNGMITRYGHASKLFVHAGDQVTKGQAIGIVGTTGHSTGPHVHFEIYWNGARKNPLAFYK